jgi:hypothetical protein
LKPHDDQNHESSRIGREDACSPAVGFAPLDVACRIFGSNTIRASCEKDRQKITTSQQQEVIASGLLSFIPFPASIDARGTEHAVRFRGKTVEKFQHSNGWVPIIDPTSKLAVTHATPLEYLKRLELQNLLFGDEIRVIGITRANRFVTSQPTLRGGEPSENDIRDVLIQGGWKRIPIESQNLPHQLMGSAWHHNEEQLILLDARKPNFKKTAYGTLPIDLIIGELTPEMAASLNQ